MTPLEGRLLRRIAAEGPLSVADFMAAALLDPQHGYYTTAAPLGDESGSRGDFVTAPELSQVFGELLGLWCLEAWQRLGAPGRFLLAELGPGRGSLMSDVWRSLALLPACRAAAEIHLVEASPRLTAVQRQALAGLPVTWHQSLSALPEGPLVLLANEFFDALPIRQYEMSPEGWRERLVVRGPTGGLAFALGGVVPAGLLPPGAAAAPLGGVLEISPAGRAIAAELGRRLTEGPGTALFVDYGYAEAPLRGSLQAMAGHRLAPPLEAAGAADLSALVDFAALAAAAAPAAAFGPVSQRALLLALGFEARLSVLRRDRPDAQAARIEAAARRLIDPEAMGTLFLALALQAPNLSPPPGFPLPEENCD